MNYFIHTDFNESEGTAVTNSYKNDRPSWDEYFIEIAKSVSSRADCKRRKVGCVIVDNENKILSTGYNGVRPGASGCLEGACPRGQLSYDEIKEFSNYNDPESPGFCISQHAESNALIHAGRDCKGSTVYITDPPCIGCQKLLYNAGVNRIVWGVNPLRQIVIGRYEVRFSPLKDF